jgi:hypothetical protein
MWVSTQFSASTGKRYIFITDAIPDAHKVNIAGICKRLGIILELVSKPENLLERVLKAENAGKSARLLMFYSPKDIEYAIGWEAMQELIDGEVLIQKRNLRGKAVVAGTTVYLRDEKGWAGPGGLANLASQNNVLMASKPDMDAYKSHMLDGLLNEPQKFIEYSMGDTDALLEIERKFVELVRWVQADVIGIPLEDCFRVDDIPSTTGALIAATLEKWIFSLAPDKELFKFAMRKLGIVNPDAKDFNFTLKSFLNMKRYKNSIQLKADFAAINTGVKSQELNELNHFTHNGKFDFTALNQASIGYYAIQLDSSVYAALVQGGRCNNERPTEYRVNYGADIDLSSCYGSALRGFSYPIGLPTTWACQSNQKRETLGKWLKRNEANLIDGLWTVVVGGKLNYCQDLIYSKIVTSEEINRTARKGWDKDFGSGEEDVRDNDLSHIPGDFALCRSTIQNGVITSYLLEIIRKVATNQELKNFMDLEVVTATAYLKSDQIGSIEEWVDHVISSNGNYYNKNFMHNEVTDKRTRKFVLVPLEEFIGKLVDKRGEVKKASKIATGDDKAILNAKQNGLKLFVNTTYGVICSPYFTIGNTVVANNITGKARAGAWMLNKALHTRQSITDGGIYGLMEVPIITSKHQSLPGLDSLSNNLDWKDKQYTRILKPLGGINWVDAFKSGNNALFLQSYLDKLVETHINEFWSFYKLSLPFSIEHKEEHTFTIAAYLSKGHYHLKYRVPDKDGTTEKVALRGARKIAGSLIHPTYAILQNIIDGVDDYPPVLEYQHRHLLSIAEWRLSDATKRAHHRPGDEVIQNRVARYNNLHCFLSEPDDFKRRSQRRTFHRGVAMQFFERHSHLGIDAVIDLMNADKL